MTRLVFIDTETTSLRPDRRAWEIGLITREPGVDVDSEHSWFVDLEDLDLGNADLMSLKIGRFYERHVDVQPIEEVDPFDTCVRESYAMEQVERLTRGAILVGAVPNFDAEVLGTRMRAHGICPSWHYHLVDVETLAAGHRGFRPPWGFDDILKAYGLEYDEADRHTALGDARMARDLYDAVMGDTVLEAEIVVTAEQAAAIVDANLSQIDGEADATPGYAGDDEQGQVLPNDAVIEAERGPMFEAYQRNRAQGRDQVESAARAMLGLT